MVVIYEYWLTFEPVVIREIATFGTSASDSFFRTRCNPLVSPIAKQHSAHSLPILSHFDVPNCYAGFLSVLRLWFWLRPVIIFWLSYLWWLWNMNSPLPLHLQPSSLQKQTGGNDISKGKSVSFLFWEKKRHFSVYNVWIHNSRSNIIWNDIFPI